MQAKLSSSFSNRSLTLKLLKTAVSYSLPAHPSPLTQISTSPSKKLHRSLGWLQYVAVGQATHAELRKRASWRTLLYWTSYIQNSLVLKYLSLHITTFLGHLQSRATKSLLQS